MAKRNRNNILAVYQSATPVEIELGKDWYKQANRQAAIIGARSGCSVSTMAGVIGALSPNQPWTQNILAAEKLGYAWRQGLDPLAVRIPCYGANKVKAWRILEGEEPLAVLKGNKVRSFYSNIAFPEAVGPVTVDGHAFAIWSGERITITEATAKGLSRVGVYEKVAADYATVAEELGLRPQELQAITWLAWRRKWAWRRVARREGER